MILFSLWLVYPKLVTTMASLAPTYDELLEENNRLKERITLLEAQVALNEVHKTPIEDQGIQLSNNRKMAAIEDETSIEDQDDDGDDKDEDETQPKKIEVIEAGSQEWRDYWEEEEEERQKTYPLLYDKDGKVPRFEKKKKFVLNGGYGGYGLSDWALKQFPSEPSRGDNRLIEMVETDGKKVNGRCANLGITEMPEDYFVLNCFRIDEYDGAETLILLHDKWLLLKFIEILREEELTVENRIKKAFQFQKWFDEELCFRESYPDFN